MQNANQPKFYLLPTDSVLVLYKGFASCVRDFSPIDNTDELQLFINNQLSIKRMSANELLENHEVKSDDENRNKIALGYFAVNYCIYFNKVVPEMRQLIIDNEIPIAALHFINHFGADNDMRQMLLNLNDPYIAFLYCRLVNDDADMRQIIINSKQVVHAIEYLVGVGNQKDIFKMVLNAKEPAYAYQFCSQVSDDPEMRQIITDSGEPEWAFKYCENVRNDLAMAQIIVDAGNPQWVVEYAAYMAKVNLKIPSDLHAAMRKVILDSTDPYHAYVYCCETGFDEDMRDALINNISADSPEDDLTILVYFYEFVREDKKIKDHIELINNEALNQMFNKVLAVE